MKSFFRRLRWLTQRSSKEAELREELEFHLEEEASEREAAGLPQDEARRTAHRGLGNGIQVRENARAAWGWTFLEQLVQDFRYAARQLWKNPTFAGTAIFVLALGIATAVTIFGFVQAALIRPLPYRDQSRLVAVFESSPGYPRGWLSYSDFEDWRRLSGAFRSLDAYALNGSFTFSTGAGAEQVPGTRVSASFFRMLGVTPALGRDFHDGEESLGTARTVVISYAAWQKRFGGKQDILGRTVTLNGYRAAIVGVLPKGFQFAPDGGAEFWTTLRSTDSCEQHRGCHNLIAIARLKDGVTIESASANLRSIAQQLQRQYPDTNRDTGGANLIPLRDFIIGDVQPILFVLLNGAGILLLIAVVNVTTLLLARSEKRRREIAVRCAIGASSSRLFYQFAAEGLVLAFAGCIVGLAFAGWGIRLLAGLVPADKIESMPFLRDARLDASTVAFACFVSLFAAVIFSIIPVARGSMAAMMEGLKAGGRGSAGAGWRRFGAGLVVTELALAMVLLTSAGLLGKSLYQLLHVDVGFQASHLLYFQTSWAPGKYESDEQIVALDQRMVDEVRGLPGVVSVGTSTAPPIDSAWGTTSFHIVGRPNHGETNESIHRQVSPDYFRAIQARLWKGRDFREADNASKHLVAIVNRTLAKRYFPDEDPIGKQIYYGSAPQAPMEIVGVVSDIKEGPLEASNSSALYVPNGQNVNVWPSILVRTSSAEASLVQQVPAAIHRIDPFITVSAGVTMTERIDQSPSAYLHRSAAWLVGLFAAMAMSLGIIGFYGVVAYSVGQRTQEIGVRMAIGARRSTVYRLILGEAGRLTAIGIALGLGGSLGAAAMLRSMLFGVESWDVPTLVVVAVVLALATLLASFVPARRAASVNPVEALRSE